MGGRTRASAVALAAVVGGGLLTGCSSSTTGTEGGGPEPSPSGTLAYCQGTQTGMAVGTPVRITVHRAGQVLADISAEVGMKVSAAIPPGDFTVEVDGRQQAKGTVTSGSTVYGQSGSGCPT